MKTIISIFFLLVFTSELEAQNSFIGGSLSNTTTGLPVISYPDLFYSQFHPGASVYYTRQLNKNETNRFIIIGNIDFYYHQFVQSLLKIYPTFSYERKISDRFFTNVGVGAGYGISFEGKNAFKLTKDGSYLNKSFLGARSQYLVALEFGASYKIFGDRSISPLLIIQLKSFMQGTYVKSYVPLLPLNSVNLGIRIPLKSTAK